MDQNALLAASVSLIAKLIQTLVAKNVLTPAEAEAVAVSAFAANIGTPGEQDARAAYQALFPGFDFY